MISDAKLEPDWVYEADPPEVWEIQCQEKQFFSCVEWMNRTELTKHYLDFHKGYGDQVVNHIEALFEQERTRRYGQ